MNTASRTKRSHAGATCTAPQIGSRLPDYIVDLLDDTAAEQVETHLVECQHCKSLYMTVLQIRAARGKRTHEGITPSANNGRPPSTDQD